jgi:hypothetical protein
MLEKLIDKKIKKNQILLCGSGRQSQSIYKKICNNFHSQSKIFFLSKKNLTNNNMNNKLNLYFIKKY